MPTLSGISIFSSMPIEQQRSGTWRLLGNIRTHGTSPEAFTRGAVVPMIALGIFCALSIIVTPMLQHWPAINVIVMELLFLSSMGAILLSNRATRLATVLAYAALAFILSVVLNVLFHDVVPYEWFQGNWGNFGLWLLCGIACYRFPARWAWFLVIPYLIALVATNGVSNLPHVHNVQELYPLLLALLSAAWFCWLWGMSRSRVIIFLSLQEVQEQLHAEMIRTGELAATQERARIARDIHDVLAHSLTILSIQVQAARQLVHSDPERLATRLDQMAILLRESMVESRRVVGLLRETEPTSSSRNGVATDLYRITSSFSERTGIRCEFVMQGVPGSLDNEQEKTLQFTLQEALTNAYRHGGAHTIHVKLDWQKMGVTLNVCDDGRGEHLCGLQNEGASGHGQHGLQGMRERARALGGELQAGSDAHGGFAVKLAFPLVNSAGPGAFNE